MRDETLFQLAVNLVTAKLQAHFISPAQRNVGDWIDDQVLVEWQRLRRLWQSHHTADTDPTDA